MGKALLKNGLRLLLLGGGITLLVILVDHAGPENVWQAIKAAAPWLPLLIVLEAGFVAWDAFIVRHLAGEVGKQTPWWAHLRAALIAYPFMAVMPAGRAGAEAARATALAHWYGGSRAAAVAAQTQGFLLVGNGLISIPILIAMIGVFGFPTFSDMTFADGLTVGVGVNMLAGCIVGFGLVATLRGARIGGFVGRMFSKLADGGEKFDQHTRESKSWFLPSLLATSGRAVQALQYGLFILAVGGGFSLIGTMIAHGTHLAGALVGDLVPGQVGIVEGAFQQSAPHVFATYGFTSAQAAMGALVTVELLRKITHVFWAGIGFAVPMMWRIPDAPQINPTDEHALAKLAEEDSAGEDAGAATDDENDPPAAASESGEPATVPADEPSGVQTAAPPA